MFSSAQRTIAFGQEGGCIRTLLLCQTFNLKYCNGNFWFLLYTNYISTLAGRSTRTPSSPSLVLGFSSHQHSCVVCIRVMFMYTAARETVGGRGGVMIPIRNNEGAGLSWPQAKRRRLVLGANCRCTLRRRLVLGANCRCTLYTKQSIACLNSISIFLSRADRH